MIKIKENLFEVFLCLYSLRSFIVGPTISDAIIAIFLILSIVYIKNYLKKDSINDKEIIQKDIQQLKQEIAKITLDRGIRQLGNNGLR